MRARVAAFVAVLAGAVFAVTGCGRAADSVTTIDRDPAATPVSPTTATAVATTARRNPSTTSGEARPIPTVATTAVTTAPPMVVTVPSPPGTAVSGPGPKVLSVACARHPEDGGDWVVFTLSSSATSVAAAFGTGVAGLGVTGDATLLVTLTPATDATGGRFSFGATCDHVGDVASVPRPDGSLVWVIGTKGLPRLLNTPAPAASQGGWALVVKLGS
jgi:hypothetical protein